MQPRSTRSILRFMESETQEYQKSKKGKLGTLYTWNNPEVISKKITRTRPEKNGYLITYELDRIHDSI